MSHEVFILGGAQTDFQRNWAKEGKSFVAMMKEVTEDALDAIDLDFGDIAALNRDDRIIAFVGNFNAEQYVKQGHLGAFFTELDRSFYGMAAARYEAACASGAVAIDAARAKLLAGDCDVALVLGIEIMKTVSSIVGGDFLGMAAYYSQESRGVEHPFPNLFGRLADEIIEKYKLNEDAFLDALAEISAINYANAKLNPRAQTRQWFMNREHAQQRGSQYNACVGSRLAVSDCSQVTDGAALTILCNQRYAETYAARQGIGVETIPRIKGTGFHVAPVTMAAKMADSYDNEFILPHTKRAVDAAYSRAGLQSSDIDVFELHDCFTSSEFAMISSTGITEPGRELDAIESGSIRIEGKTPVNPSGGLIGCGHPVGATGVRMLLDLFKQCTEGAGDYQVHGAKNGLMLNIGGSATTNIAFVVGV